MPPQFVPPVTPGKEMVARGALPPRAVHPRRVGAQVYQVLQAAIFSHQRLARRGVLRCSVLGSDHIFRPKAVASQGGGFTGKGCVGCLFLGSVRLWSGAFFNTENRLACYPIENIHESCLAHLRQSRNLLSVFYDIDQSRRGGKIVVPNVMMNGLKVPFVLARHRIERH